MTVPGQKGKFTPELRIVVASLLSMIVILLWAKFFVPKPPAQPPQANRPAQTAPATPGTTAPPSSSPQAPASSVAPTAVAAAPPVSVTPRSDSQERTITIENNLYELEISNRGAVVKSWKLKKYRDDCSYGHRTLDVVQNGQNDCSKSKEKDLPRETGGWPFALVLDGEEQQNAANNGLYQVASDGTTLHAPADVQLQWSDGHLEVTKHFRFDNSYVVRVDTSVKLNGKPIAAGLGWLGGFGDLTVTNPTPVETVTTYYSEGGKISNYPHKKLEGIDKWSPGFWQGGKDFVGIEDRYFTAAFLPPNGSAPGTLGTRYWKAWRNVHNVDANGQAQDTSEPVPEVAVASSAQPLAVRVYVGPKDYDDLKKMNPALHGLVNFGWLEFIADPLFHGLKWLHNYIPNWGWAIVVLTLVINMLLFPLRISSYKTTLKMQKVAPEIKAIQEKYKKYSMRDPRKAEMNKEVMAIYAREGINPVGGCFQMFLQMPVWFGLNTALRYAIEMRHATWLWIRDLSAKDPYYALPILMGVSMYLVSKMTPMTTTDPQQQMMMKIMPITMAGIFMISPISSGLAVYILTSSVVGIGQQWYLNRAHPVSVPAKPARSKNGRKS